MRSNTLSAYEKKCIEESTAAYKRGLEENAATCADRNKFLKAVQKKVGSGYDRNTAVWFFTEMVDTEEPFEGVYPAHLHTPTREACSKVWIG